ncbi:MAG: DUF3369 domain-containing protein [Magnetococcales bacterium]|nr:DUF3369 domain-containing protein [Magnetococcales bacterium]
MSITSAWKNRHTKQPEQPSEQQDSDKYWKVLIVDDDPDILILTRINLKNFVFDGRPLQLLEAKSAQEAKQVMAKETNIALALVDVVMETDDAGILLVEYIRNTLKQKMIRLVIRTGQPGMAPERYVIDNYDIDDYKDKTELTSQKLYTTVRTAIKAYRDLREIEDHRQSMLRHRDGLNQILAATPQLYRYRVESFELFFQGILSQVVALCDLGTNGYFSSIKGMIATMDGRKVEIQTGIGEYADLDESDQKIKAVQEYSMKVLNNEAISTEPFEKAMVMPLKVEDKLLGFIYFETPKPLEKGSRELIQVLANQSASALENIHLHTNLESAYNQAINMMALAAEFKDTSTGTHIMRVAELTERMALELGLDAKASKQMAEASKLHDIGKIGVPDAVLQKPGKLTESEYEVIKSHAGIGAQILKDSPAFELAQDVALSHHERWDGRGYPRGIKGLEISLISRIVAVVDVFDALVNVRPYKQAWSVEDAVAEIKNGAGTQFDPQVVEAFVRLYENNTLSANRSE